MNTPPLPRNIQGSAMSDDKPSGLALLRVPFPANQISYLPKAGVKLAYVGHAALTDRLLDADPMWTWEPLAIGSEGLPVLDPFNGMWIKLTVCGVTRLGYGHAGAKEGGDAIKEVIGDALRNAAMRFGAALDLWHKGDLHGDEETKPVNAAVNPTKEAAKIAAKYITDERKFELEEIALNMVDAHKNEHDTIAIAAYYSLLDNEEKIFVWNLLQAESKLRAILKANSPHRPIAGKAAQGEQYATADRAPQ